MDHKLFKQFRMFPKTVVVLLALSALDPISYNTNYLITKSALQSELRHILVSSYSNQFRTFIASSKGIRKVDCNSAQHQTF